MSDLEETIQTKAAQVAEAEADGQKARQHPLPDLIEADKYAKSNRAARATKRGLSFGQLKPE